MKSAGGPDAESSQTDNSIPRGSCSGTLRHRRLADTDQPTGFKSRGTWSFAAKGAEARQLDVWFFSPWAGKEKLLVELTQPVARLVPVKREVSTEQRVAAIERIQQLATGLSLGGWKVKALIHEGR